MKLKVHLVFPGTCEEALTFYQTTLGGEIDFIFRKSQEEGRELEEADKEKISHMVVRMPQFELAGEDADASATVMEGNNNKLVLSLPNLDDCSRILAAFAQNGTVTMPLEKTFFSDGMGEVTDKYGISWIIMVADEGY